MKKTFKSKIDLAILIPVVAILTCGVVYLMLIKIMIGAIAVTLVLAFLIYLCIDTMYQLTDDHKLKIKSGFLYHQEIYIKSIKKVSSIKNRRASPLFHLTVSKFVTTAMEE